MSKKDARNSESHKDEYMAKQEDSYDIQLLFYEVANIPQSENETMWKGAWLLYLRLLIKQKRVPPNSTDSKVSCNKS